MRAKRVVSGRVIIGASALTPLNAAIELKVRLDINASADILAEMLEVYVVAHIAGGACLAAAGLEIAEPRQIGPIPPTVASAAFAVAGLALILVGHFTV